MRRLGEVCPLAVIKDGLDGAPAIRHSEMFYAPAIPVNVVDTTGAGEACGAGFLKAWLDGKPMAECRRWGNMRWVVHHGARGCLGGAGADGSRAVAGEKRCVSMGVWKCGGVYVFTCRFVNL